MIQEIPERILSLVPPANAMEKVAPQKDKNKNGLIATNHRSTSILDKITFG